MRQKSIFILGELNKDAVATFLDTFHKMEAKPGVTYIYISSEGGEVDAGLAIFETLKTSSNPIVTVGIGAICSMAVILLQAGDYRIITQGSTMLVHDGSINVQTTLLAAKAHMEHSMFMHDWYCAQLAERSGQSVEAIQELASKETFLDANQALSMGLVDEVRSYRQRHVLTVSSEDSCDCCFCQQKEKKEIKKEIKGRRT